MTSKSSSESIPSDVKEDVNLILKHHQRLASRHKLFESTVSDALDAYAELADSHHKKLRSDNKRLNWLALAVIVQAVYLIILL